MVVRVGWVELEVDGDALQERRGVALAGKVRRHVEDQPVAARIERPATCQIGDSPVCVRFGQCQALVAAVRSESYRRMLGELPGYDSQPAGEWEDIR